MDPQLFCLRWNNHQSNLLSVFGQLLQIEAFCDVTLACDGGSIKCHKMVLAACSNYFQKLFMENDCNHPIVFLKDITYVQIRAILDYMYMGEVSVQEEDLNGMLRIAEALKVKGLVEIDEEDKASTKPINSALGALLSSPSKANKNINNVVRQTSAAGAKLPIWPVSTSKLLKPSAKSLVNPKPVGEEDGVLVIDESSGGPVTMVRYYNTLVSSL